MLKVTQEDVMEKWNVNNTDTPLVSIRCTTYNHEKYISQALDGFLIQKTTFPFEVIVHDDASTDKTADIIREYEKKYPLIIKPIYETENQYSKHDGSLSKIVNDSCNGKYIACCEGDDYWIDRSKLQREILFLEKNCDYGMVYSYSYVEYGNSGKIVHKLNGRRCKSYEDLFINGNKIPTLTVCYRKEIDEQYLEEINPTSHYWKMGDLPRWLWYYKNSKVYFDSKVTGVYRILKESASHFIDPNKKVMFEKSVDDIICFFGNLYNSSSLLVERENVKLFKKAFYDKNRMETNRLGKILNRKYMSIKSKLIFFCSCNSVLFKCLLRIIK